MDYFEVVEKRRSIRNFLDKIIKKEFIEQIINTARFAPTARNIQPWKFVIISNQEVKAKIAEIAPNGSFISMAPICIAVFCEVTKYYLEDGSAATTIICNAAAALGIGTCWIAGDKKPYCETVMKIVNAPRDCKLVSLIALGYASEEVRQKDKKPLKEILFWGMFKNESK